MTTITKKLTLFILFLLCLASLQGSGQVYVHDFGGTTIATHPYIVTPTTLNANLSSSSWSNSTSSWTNFGGSTGEAISLSNSNGTPTITLTFAVNPGFQLEIDSYSFWRRRSNTGAQNYAMTINGNNVGSGTVPTAGANIGTITTGLPLSNITGTVTVVISLSGASSGGTLRLDDFTLNGTVTPIPTGSEINLLGNSIDIVDGDNTPSLTDHTDFGSVTVSTPFTRTFTIQNTGSANLVLSGVPLVAISGTHAADFSVTIPPSTPITAGSSTTFDITFTPSALGLRTATLTIDNNDGNGDEIVYNFAIQGTGINSNTSDIIITPTFVYSTNIPYINYQTTDITSANIGVSSIELAQFTIRDGGGIADGDALATTLNNLQFSLLTCSAIRRLAIYDGTTEIQEITPTCAFASFSALGLVAPDNGSKTFRIIASFVASPITDNSQIRFTLTSATALNTGSIFNVGNAGGAQSSIAGDNNRLVVTATALAFGVQPSNTAINATMSFPTILAVDINGNIDLDFVGNVTITSTGTLDVSPKTAIAVTGTATFNNIIHTVSGTSYTLTANTTGLSSIISGNFNIINQTVFQAGDLMFVGFDNQISGVDDKISIVTMIDILPNTSFVYANAVYEVGAAANVRTKRWYACDGNADDLPESFDITYTGGSTITAGSIICFTVLGSGPDASTFTINAITSSFSVIRSANSNTLGGANMSTSNPDAVFLMQGTWTDNVTYATFSGSILGGIQQGGTWYNITNNLSAIPTGNQKRISRIPPEIDCFAVQATTSTGNSVAYYNGVRTSNSQPVHINNIINFAGNWVSNNGTTGNDFPASVCDNNFVVTTLGLAGKWTGTANTNWFNCRNWENFTVPNNTTNVTISPTATNNPTVLSTATNADLYFATSDNTQRVAECNNINISKLNLTLEHGANNRLDVYGNITISSTGGIDMNDGNNATNDGIINLRGNWINNLTTTAFDEGNGNINFVGTSAQTITTTGGTETFYNANLNNTAGLSLSNTNMLISNNLTFTNGILAAPSATTARVEFLAGTTATSVGTNKYVAGWVRKVGNTAFDFPVGDEGYYALARISAPSNITDHFTATYDRVFPNPYNSSLVKSEGALTLNHVDNCEYWDVQRTNGSSNVFLTLAYEDTRSCKITPGFEADMRIAHWDGTQWENNGNSNTNVISSTYGTITSGAPITSFSPFTLGSISIFNPLPIEIVSFTAKINQNNSAQLDWITVSELNAKGFDIEKSLDGKTFTKIAYQKALGGVDIIKNYQMIDESFKNAAYFRLKMIDNNESFKYSKIVYLNNQKANAYELVIIPNPTQGEVKLVLGNALPTENVTLKVFSVTGKELISLFGNVLEVERQLSNQTILLPAGMYVVRMQIGEQILQTKLIKN